MSTIEIIETGDGSHSLYNRTLNETYHSRHGAIQESRHVYIEQGLACFQPASNSVLNVLEVGFGTGLNALLAWQWARQTRKCLHYTTLEPFPLLEEVYQKLNYAATIKMEEEFKLLHTAPFGKVIEMDPSLILQKLTQTLQTVNLASSNYHVIFFDAFGPEKQPDMWTLDLFVKLRQAMADGAKLVTYCAKGQVKRDLRNAGLQVESLPGPPGKREMIRATHHIPQNAVTNQP